MTGLLAWLDTMHAVGGYSANSHFLLLRRSCAGCRHDVAAALRRVTGYARVVSPAGVA